MMRNEPPSLATWMLEHLLPGHQDEALAGDLLEDFHAGRSRGWYWRQVFAACATGWLRYLRDRWLIFMFAVVWSMLAPVWTALQDKILHGSGQTWRMDLSFTGLSGVVAWLVLNLSFVWAGAVLYFASHPGFAKRFTRQQVVRAFLGPALVFLPVYMATFIVVNLYFFPGPQIDRRTMTLLTEFTDLRLWANAIRIPFLITLLCGLWGAIPRPRKSPTMLSESGHGASLIQSAAIELVFEPGEFSVKQFFVFVVAAGLLNSVLAAFLLCRLPESHATSVASLFVRGVVYVAVGLLGGIAGTWLYWNRPSSPFRANPPISFALFTLIGSATWVWMPSAVLLSLQDSPVAPLIAMVSATLLAVGLRGPSSVVLAPAQPGASLREGSELFATALYSPPIETHGYLIAFCIYTSGYALVKGSTLTSSTLAAAATFLFAWKWEFAPSGPFNRRSESKRAELRLSFAVVPAILVTVWALLDGVAQRDHAALINAGLLPHKSTVSNSLKLQPSGLHWAGYESIILLPPPQKKQIIFPLHTADSLFAPEKSRPLVIRFDGNYWYLQPPDIRPGPTAHKAHGTPLAVNIKSSNSITILMEAHQTLGKPIRLASCREIQVEIENRDNQSSAIQMAVLLTDSRLPGKPTLYLGQKPLLASESDSSQPEHQTLRFAIPAHTSLRKFDQITIKLLPDIEHSLVAPKIAIEQFQLSPR